MENKLETINKDFLKDKIYIVRGQKVMIDSDFRFQLTNEEVREILRSKNVTSSWGW